MSEIKNKFAEKVLLVTAVLFLSVGMFSCAFNDPEPDEEEGLGFIKGFTRDIITKDYISEVLINFNDTLVTTDTNGFFEIADMQAVSHKLSALKDGYITESKLVDVAKDDTTYVEFNLTPASRFYYVTGYVRNENSGEFLNQAEVIINGITHYTDVSGSYLISGIASGTYLMKATAEGFDTSSYQVTITGDTTFANFWLNRNDGFGIVNGYVQNRSSLDPVALAKVTVNSQVTYTNTDGFYIFSDIPKGTYYLKAEKDGFEKDSVIVAVKENESTFANIQLDAQVTPEPDPVVWEYKNTGSNHVIAIPLSANPNIDGVALQPGDFIGVYYDSSGVDACAGYIVWNGAGNQTVAAWGDDSVSPEKDGFSANETIKWKFRRNSDKANYEAVATYSSGGGNYTTNGLSLVSTIRAK